MQLSKIVWVFIVLCVSVEVRAEDEFVNKYRNYTPQQIADLPEKERSSKVPMMYSFAARSGLAKGAELQFAMQLNTLMYPGIDDYESAVKSFQGDLGDKATGILTVWQIHNLEKRSGFQKLSRVSFPSDYYSRKSDDYATVRGTMMIHGERIAWPVNYFQLKCYKSGMYCELDELYLIFPDNNSWTQTFDVMQKRTQYYDVTNWSNDIVDAVPSDQGDGCRVTALNLNFKAKEFYQITRNGTEKCEILGVALPKLERPQVAQVVDGEGIINREFRELREKAFSFLSREFRGKVEKLKAENK
ncbi:hypothetical protein ACJJIU_10475 [Microbulbifer sp. CnH-101-E]|uniref:hypothetical protein n=1 Tax=unclassified Microbulbifer TaxID=2619833 RepID=UPI0040397A61